MQTAAAATLREVFQLLPATAVRFLPLVLYRVRRLSEGGGGESNSGGAGAASAALALLQVSAIQSAIHHRRFALPVLLLSCGACHIDDTYFKFMRRCFRPCVHHRRVCVAAHSSRCWRRRRCFSPTCQPVLNHQPVVLLSFTLLFRFCPPCVENQLLQRSRCARCSRCWRHARRCRCAACRCACCATFGSATDVAGRAWKLH